MVGKRKWPLMILAVLVSAGLITSGMVWADTTDSTVYGSGNFGNCDYGACTITLSDSGLPSMAVVPTLSGKCTVKSDVVSVLTDSTTGYSLTMTTSTTNNAMLGPGSSITTSGGTTSAPVALAMNTWGYRVDGLGAFGAGPTSSQDSANVPSVAFAGVPTSVQAPTLVASSLGPANPAANTTTWFGVCANAGIPAGTYSTTILYTAVTN
jgi:hypothetical protein